MITDQQAIRRVQFLSDHLPSADGLKFFDDFKESLDLVLKLACKGADQDYPQRGCGGGIIFE